MANSSEDSQHSVKDEIINATVYYGHILMLIDGSKVVEQSNILEISAVQLD